MTIPFTICNLPVVEGECEALVNLNANYLINFGYE